MTPYARTFNLSPDKIEGKEIDGLEISSESLVLSFSPAHYVQFGVEQPYFNPYFDKLTIELQGFTSQFIGLPILECMRRYFSIRSRNLNLGGGYTSKSIYELRTRVGIAKFTFNLQSPSKVFWISLTETIEGGPIC